MSDTKSNSYWQARGFRQVISDKAKVHNVSFKNTRLAVAEFDAGEPMRYRLWETAESLADVDHVEMLDKLALLAVQRAFYRDTSAFNSQASCSRVDIRFARRMAELTTEADLNVLRTRARRVRTAYFTTRRLTTNLAMTGHDDNAWLDAGYCLDSMT